MVVLASVCLAAVLVAWHHRSEATRLAGVLALACPTPTAPGTATVAVRHPDGTLSCTTLTMHKPYAKPRNEPM